MILKNQEQLPISIFRVRVFEAEALEGFFKLAGNIKACLNLEFFIFSSTKKQKTVKTISAYLLL